MRPLGWALSQYQIISRTTVTDAKIEVMMPMVSVTVAVGVGAGRGACGRAGSICGRMGA